MTGVQLATASTWLWIVATVSLFILLANWSSGSSWGLTASIVRGVRSWSDRDEATGSLTSPSAETLRPMLDPYAFLRRDVRDGEPFGASLTRDEAADVEIIELGERRLPPR
jgi:hypothetical protein